MRLIEVERQGLWIPYPVSLYATVSGMRLPDAARIVVYHRDFYGKPMASWTHAAMRGESSWPVGERDLIAAI